MLVVQINFDDPAEDGKAIRRHCYLKGKIDQLVEMLRDDYPDPDAIAAAERAQQLGQPE
jgi:hypothetical protein